MAHRTDSCSECHQSINFDQDYFQKLMEALTQLEQAGIQLKQNKCVFLLHSMEYLGHAISEARLKTTADTFRALVDAPEPKGSSHAVVYLLRGSKEKFIPNLSSALAQMHQLLQNIQGVGLG